MEPSPTLTVALLPLNDNVPEPVGSNTSNATLTGARLVPAVANARTATVGWRTSKRTNVVLVGRVTYTQTKPLLLA